MLITPFSFMVNYMSCPLCFVFLYCMHDCLHCLVLHTSISCLFLYKFTLSMTI